MRSCFFCPLLLIADLTIACTAIAADARVERHVLIFGEEGKFAGWPANHGMWIWDNEILYD